MQKIPNTNYAEIIDENSFAAPCEWREELAEKLGSLGVNFSRSSGAPSPPNVDRDLYDIDPSYITQIRDLANSWGEIPLVRILEIEKV